MKEYLLAFHQIPKCSNVRLSKIWHGSRNFKAAWQEAQLQDFLRWGIEAEAAQEIMQMRGKIDPEQELLRLRKTGATVVFQEDKEYPLLLKEIPDPPFLLYVLGDMELLSQTSLAVVGTRLMSSYGKQVLEHILPPLVQAGLVIISGLAMGVDAYAHKVTLQQNGKTVAVLGSGIDKIYPANNRKLGEEIIKKGGALISEFPLGMEPTNYSFPVRNRIISGLSRGTLVVEAKAESGSLITARLALEQNREVFAVPGNIFAANMQGTHNLIRTGEAKLVTSANDILDELGLGKEMIEQLSEGRKIEFDNTKEEQIFLLLSKEPQLLDQVIRTSNFASSEVNALLTVLEIKGLVQNLGGGMWVRK